MRVRCVCMCVCVCVCVCLEKLTGQEVIIHNSNSQCVFLLLFFGVMVR